MESEDPNTFTQKDLMQNLLHASQHAATREELDGVRRDLKADILKVESGLKADILKVESSISKIDSKFDRLQWLIVGVIISVFLKDSIIALFSSAPAP
ncbi:MAG: hypothetical protein HN382_09875 [Gammaproteobacteria bacterium]|jgi:hypothetical protein|nr:hypothetical protein [Gammaproteobacteria bacterium]MBT6555563.1 hypothetical protein [Candidatus Neomarinimicrobiota bacterium]MBT3471830.1 hypothetical protein [Gammaproteobacteria bacterium]MBT3966983.1 hypothetical protein [Gammaproteobacteria bacterium]MBT4328433.1 hypothetical protein [Gammaproteobacteria bacterium]